MRNFLRIAFWLISSLLLFNACSIRHHSNYKKSSAFEIKENDFIANHFQKVLFNTQIHAFGNDVSGLLFIKLMAKEDYRFVFLTQMGMKIFDVELKRNQFEVHQLVSYLDKKSVRKVLENDLSLLIQTPILFEKSSFFQHKEDGSLLLREKHLGKFYYYQYQEGLIMNKESSSAFFLGTKIKYFYKGGNLPQNILIKHSGINLEWELKPIKNKPREKEE